MTCSKLDAAIARVPAGMWAVGVSGGADSVAMLSLLRARSDLSLHVVHLDHQTRGIESEQDARFVSELCARLNLPCTLARRDQLEAGMPDLPANPSARYRALRLALFGQVVMSHGLLGVVLAHHADDQAETVLQRLLRGSGYAGLAGMAIRTQIGQLVVLRPLLDVRRGELREYLVARQIAWREDSSNQSGKYLRNRLRAMLKDNPQLAGELLKLATACGQLRDWARSAAPAFDLQIRAVELARLPGILADESARRWLIDRGVPLGEVEPEAIARLIDMASDAASGPRRDFPGGVHVCRRRGMIGADG